MSNLLEEKEQSDASTNGQAVEASNSEMQTDKPASRPDEMQRDATDVTMTAAGETVGTKRTTESFMDTNELNEDGPPKTRQKTRTGSPAGTKPTLNQAHKRTQRQGSRSSTQPRWHNQAYMLFLALRQHPDRCLSRPELIKAALALDEKISKERNLPRVFKGKTPMNSASASLTTNTDRYFIPFRPDGSRAMHFKLAYEPGSFKDAVREYRKWEKKLAEHDWPYCFGVPKEKKPPSTAPVKTDEEQLVPEPEPKQKPEAEPKPETAPMTEFDEFIARRRRKADNAKKKTDNNALEDGSNAATMKAIEEKENSQDLVRLEDLDLSDVPKSWRDIVRVGESTIPGAGRGLFATRKLPYNSPLGFYFGVPMTEDEYDSLKDGVGRASEYSIMYRRTVLDATDDQGQPFTDPDGEIFCPFHFMNETNEKQANILFVEGALVNQVICWTKRDIEPGEELLVWYGRDVDRHWSPSPSSSHNDKKSPSSPSPNCK